jgi:hypothetical protein
MYEKYKKVIILINNNEILLFKKNKYMHLI